MDSDYINESLNKYLGYRLSKEGMREFERVTARCSQAEFISSLEITEHNLKQEAAKESRHRYLCGVLWNKIKKRELTLDGYFE